MNCQERLEFVREYEPSYTSLTVVLHPNLKKAICKRFKAKSVSTYFNKTHGRRWVNLNKGIIQGCLLSRAVYSVVYGLQPRNVHIDHIDNDKLNDSIDNLQALTPKEHGIKSVSDRVRDGWNANTLRGEDAPNSKLTERKVVKLRKLYAEKGSTEFSVQDCINELALDIDNATARAIITGKGWKHAGGPISKLINATVKMRQVDNGTVKTLRKRYSKGDISLTALMKEIGVTLDVSTLSSILSGKTYSEVGGPIDKCRDILRRRTKCVGPISLTKKQVRTLRRRYRDEGLSIAKLLEDMSLPCSPNTAALIIRGERLIEYGGPIKGVDY